jgi:hypothetical protein
VREAILVEKQLSCRSVLYFGHRGVQGDIGNDFIAVNPCPEKYLAKLPSALELDLAKECGMRRISMLGQFLQKKW